MLLLTRPSPLLLLLLLLLLLAALLLLLRCCDGRRLSTNALRCCIAMTSSGVPKPH